MKRHKFAFRLYQRSKSNFEKMFSNDLVCETAQTTVQCADGFAPKKKYFTSHIENDCINNKKNALNQGAKLHPNSISQPSSADRNETKDLETK